MTNDFVLDAPFIVWILSSLGLTDILGFSNILQVTSIFAGLFSTSLFQSSRVVVTVDEV